jgi:signal transduction histidine kinase
VTEPSGSALRLSVRDEGVGIEAADIERMFQPFQSGFRQGSGLGLAIVRRIVTDHGGRVSVQSRPGAGTEVVVVLPVQASRAEADAMLRSA